MEASNHAEAVSKLKTMAALRKGKLWYYNVYVIQGEKTYFKPATMFIRKNKAFLIEGDKIKKITI